LRQLLTIPVRALDAAEIGTLAWTEAGDEKRHVRRLRSLLLCLRGEPGTT
jgi:hypothetical protein